MTSEQQETIRKAREARKMSALKHSVGATAQDEVAKALKRSRTDEQPPEQGGAGNAMNHRHNL